ncbi:hypothetical protein AGLY_007287 [Aphis glycines]|uniref:Uncharacterized protein n=1 Tax=Aphis glycines TaxID=307491 RepID=A0A6G0TQ12_APHGL|nr:hypothetical protein AGLY_007287 [Aphis glycines]
MNLCNKFDRNSFKRIVTRSYSSKPRKNIQFGRIITQPLPTTITCATGSVGSIHQTGGFNGVPLPTLLLISSIMVSHNNLLIEIPRCVRKLYNWHEHICLHPSNIHLSGRWCIVMLLMLVVLVGSPIETHDQSSLKDDQIFDFFWMLCTQYHYQMAQGFQDMRLRCYQDSMLDHYHEILVVEGSCLLSPASNLNVSIPDFASKLRRALDHHVAASGFTYQILSYHNMSPICHRFQVYL